MIEAEVIRKKKTAWTRHQAKILSLVQELETEIENLKKKNVHPDFIQKKNNQLDLIIEAVNFADELIQLLIFDHDAGLLEIFFLEKSLSKQLLQDPNAVQEVFSKEHTFDVIRNFVQSLNDSINAAQ